MIREELLRHEAAMFLFHTSAAITMSHVIRDMLEESSKEPLLNEHERELLLSGLDMAIKEAGSATERAVWYTMKDLFDEELKEFGSGTVIHLADQKESPN